MEATTSLDCWPVLASFFLNWWPTLVSFLKVLPGLLLFPLAFYLSWQKYGQEITINYSIGGNGHHAADGFYRGTITNKKDKTISIHSIFITIEKEAVLDLKIFSPPLSLKAYESTNFDFDKVSAYCCGEEELEFNDLIREKKLTFYACLPEGATKLTPLAVTSSQVYAMKNNLTVITPFASEFKGVVYNNNCLFALVYEINRTEHTSLIVSEGRVVADWPFLHSKIPREALTEPSIVANFIKDSENFKSITRLSVHDLRAGALGSIIAAAVWSRDIL